MASDNSLFTVLKRNRAVISALASILVGANAGVQLWQNLDLNLRIYNIWQDIQQIGLLRGKDISFGSSAKDCLSVTNRDDTE